MAIRTAEATWNGTLREGNGTLKVGSGTFEGAYSFASRFEMGPGTNPEELLGAAHAGCFSMFLTALLTRAGYAPTRIYTIAKVHLDEGPRISTIELRTEATVPALEEKAFQEFAEIAKQGCPVSKALTGVEIKLEAQLLR